MENWRLQSINEAETGAELIWCEEINRGQRDVSYDFVYVDEESFEKYKPASFWQLMKGFKEYNGTHLDQ
jgi:hypothetical protein